MSESDDDGPLRAALYDLLRQLYRPKRAGAIIEAFEASLLEKPDDERRAVLEYWWDFYRLRKYQRERQRRRPTFKERLTPCSRRISSETARRIMGWCLATMRYEAANGWLEGERASAARLEALFGWTEYLRANDKPPSAGEDEPE
jgi:hypothetical protein